MKTTKEKADELVEQFYYHEFDKIETHEATIHAINAVKHTIESLSMCNVHEIVDNEIKRQSELLTELESRL